MAGADHPLGGEHYERHWACYRELYPAVTAPAPAAVAEGAHAGLADHRKRRPRGLVPEAQWRILATATALEQSGTCYLRTGLIDEYQRAREKAPQGPGILKLAQTDK